ncbi:hypothetical protein LEN26_018559 [Aphanomyces euteiches]|nr:hypothetical protein LEN26_018559 [Aphanomyces euteiches]KAH9104645.1 hypothetical protein AeMF1_019346 [Aphanomyces euteiches]KAH9192153.1 hypothetical protein AeNC1_005877 [Aphanomyces euteiches]
MRIALFLAVLVAIFATAEANPRRRWQEMASAALAQKAKQTPTWLRAAREFRNNLAQGEAEDRLERKVPPVRQGSLPRQRSFSAHQKPAPQTAIQKMASQRRNGRS